MPPPPGDHVFQATGTIFKHVDIIGTNLLTKFHDDRTLNVASRVLTKKNSPPPWRPYIIGTNLLTIFHEDRTIYVAFTAPWWPYIMGTNLQTKFHDDWKINEASRVLTRNNITSPGGNVFQPTGIIFELFHEDRTINVASRVLTRKNDPPLGSLVFQANVTIFELIQDIIETNLLTKFHEDWNKSNIDAAQRTGDDGRRTKGDQKSSP
ncbi:hypothetical protein DPMN_142272 [Dreissena polymorpha]|uniref:Uncharacterized protein n=1 Tax=Dreissena polymorpha TaxID=45954 RepID=A0A9D4GBC6_DREPO|nr:hypothetical protein DPMN_142272 [Dreissena polymorpha]